jgi:hypothetical protein
MVAQIAIKSNAGFCYGIELLVKAHHLRWHLPDRVGNTAPLIPIFWVRG